MITIPTSARIAGSALCSWGTGGDWANGCENVALPGNDLCPSHTRISNYLEAQVPMTVLIDVADDDRIEQEAAAVGCTTRFLRLNRNGCEYSVTGPRSALVDLLEEWGYHEGEYEIVDTTADDYEHGEWEPTRSCVECDDPKPLYRIKEKDYCRQCYVMQP